MHAPEALHEKWRKVFPQFEDRIGKYGAGPNETCPDVVNPIAGYAAMMENLDNQIGEILRTLSDLGIDGNTLFMFSSDNGAHLEGGTRSKFLEFDWRPARPQARHARGRNSPHRCWLAGRRSFRRAKRPITSAHFGMSCQPWLK